jgi:hypothetical protein
MVAIIMRQRQVHGGELEADMHEQPEYPVLNFMDKEPKQKQPWQQ